MDKNIKKEWELHDRQKTLSKFSMQLSKSEKMYSAIRDEFFDLADKYIDDASNDYGLGELLISAKKADEEEKNSISDIKLRVAALSESVNTKKQKVFDKLAKECDNSVNVFLTKHTKFQSILRTIEKTENENL